MDKRGFVAKAWITLDKDKPRDRFRDLVAHQYNDPGYGFNLNAVLKEYGIKELKDGKLFSSIEAQMRKGSRVSVTVEKGTKEEEMFIEAAVRYSKLIFLTVMIRWKKEGSSK